MSSFPEVNVDISNVFHSHLSVSLIGKVKRNSEGMRMVSNKCTKMYAEETIKSQEQRIGNGRPQFKIPIVISGINRDAFPY